MIRLTQERVFEILDFLYDHTEEETCKHFDIKADTIRRYKSKYKDQVKEVFKEKRLFQKLRESFTPEELEKLAKSKKNTVQETHTVKRNFKGDIITFAHFTDTHIGSKYFSVFDWQAALKECEAQDVQFICHTGDLTEGLSHRAGHVYECTHYGADAQQEYAIKLLKMTDIPMYIIDGNHDRWFIKAAGVKIVKNICESVNHCTFLGHDTGRVIINGITIDLFHGEDGSSYAFSYRIQKVIESMQGGEKPHVLLVGHTHKQAYFFIRNIHAISGGALSYQSAWMKSKRMACHSGFWIIKMCVKDKEIKWLEPRWYPFYKRLDSPVNIQE